MFIFESGWRVGVKTGSTRELCYMIAPGQDYYHRLLDGEVFLVRDGERLCLSCASRRGLDLVRAQATPRGDRRRSRPTSSAMPLELWIGATPSGRTDDAIDLWHPPTSSSDSWRRSSWHPPNEMSHESTSTTDLASS